MAEPTPEPTAEAPAAQPEAEADTTDWKAEARKWEQRAKENGAAAKTLQLERQASMTEAEKAVVEAEARGKTTAMTEFGQRLARADFLAAAARRNPSYDAAGILDDVNLARYVGEDGEPDEKAIAKAVERLIPELTQSTGIPNLDLGQKQVPAAPQGMNQLIRKAAGRA